MATNQQYGVDYIKFAPAVRDLAATTDDIIRIIDIPSTQIPSPIARSLSPEQVISLKNYLVGPKGAKHGQEIWESWKRAWDLWNNHYIEGRVKKSWLKAEWDRRQKDIAGDLGRGRKKFRVRRGPQKYDPSKKPYQTLTLEKNEKLPVAAPRRKWVRRDPKLDTQTVLSGRKVVKKIPGKRVVVKRLVKKRRLKTGQQRRVYRRGKRVPIVEWRAKTEESVETKITRAKPYYPIRPWSEDVETRRNNADGSALQYVDGVLEPEPTELKTTKIKGLKEKMVSTLVGMHTEKRSALTSWSESQHQRRAGKSTTAVNQNLLNTAYKFIEQEMWVPEQIPSLAEVYAYEEETVVDEGIEMEEYEVEEDVETDDEYEEDEEESWSFVHWELVDDPDNPQPKKIKPRRGPGTATNVPESDDENFDGLPGGGDNITQIIRFEDVIPAGDGSDEDEPWIPRPVAADGSGAGFTALKSIMDFKMAPGSDGLDDIMANCVWRPRRVGEKTPQFDVDLDASEFYTDNVLIRDGGVDCGRPWPVLRHILRHVRTASEAIKKRKAWDRVTGTIFNLPNKPLEEDPSNLLEEIPRQPFSVKPNPDLFPLDIRRAKRVRAREPKPIANTAAGEELIEYDFEIPKEYREYEEYDPWRVEDEQERLRDVPDRPYPGGDETSTYSGDHQLIPYDDNNWLEHCAMDDSGDMKYFVANLHEDSVIINGQEVKKGQVAGPLPTFAVIQSPGGQISFWWGVGGRDYGQENRFYNPAAWRSLRELVGWEDIAISAGEKWDMKIMDRMNRKSKRDGGESDDDLWNEWLNDGLSEEVPAKLRPPPQIQDDSLRNYATPQSPDNPRSNGAEGLDFQVIVDDDLEYHPAQLAEPRTFATEEEELKWITAGKTMTRQGEDRVKNGKNIREPKGSNFFPGPVAESRDPPQGYVSSKEIENTWQRDKTGIIKKQKASLAATKMIAATDRAALVGRTKQQKRRGSDLYAEVIKKRYADLAKARDAIVIEDELEEVEKAEVEQADKWAKGEYMNYLHEDATVGSLRKTGLTLTEARKRARKNKADYLARKERERVQINAIRRRKGQTEFPPEEIVAATDRALETYHQLQEKREAKQESRKREQQKAKADAQKKKLEIEIKERKKAGEKKDRERLNEEKSLALARLLEKEGADREAKRLAEQQADKDSLRISPLATVLGTTTAEQEAIINSFKKPGNNENALAAKWAAMHEKGEFPSLSDMTDKGQDLHRLWESNLYTTKDEAHWSPGFEIEDEPEEDIGPPGGTGLLDEVGNNKARENIEQSLNNHANSHGITPLQWIKRFHGDKYSTVSVYLTSKAKDVDNAKDWNVPQESDLPEGTQQTIADNTIVRWANEQIELGIDAYVHIHHNAITPHDYAQTKGFAGVPQFLESYTKNLEKLPKVKHFDYFQTKTGLDLRKMGKRERVKYDRDRDRLSKERSSRKREVEGVYRRNYQRILEWSDFESQLMASIKQMEERRGSGERFVFI